VELSVLRSHIEAVTGFVERLEPASLTGECAAQLVETFSAAENACCAGKALCAKRAADACFFEQAGDKDAASWLARVTGDSRGGASDALSTAAGLDALPGLSDAFRSGRLSGKQANEVARAAAEDPAAEGSLLETARNGSLGELRTQGEAVRAARRSKEEAEARQRRIHEERRLETWTGREGAFMGRFSLTPEHGALLMGRLEAMANDLFDRARRERRQEPRRAYLADALVGLAAGEEEDQSLVDAGCGAEAGRADGSGQPEDPDRPEPPAKHRRARPDYKILMRIDLEALVRGSVAPGEECSIDGTGHVPVSVVQHYLDLAQLRLVVTRGTDVASVFSFSRTIRADLRTALEARDRACVVPGCTSTFHLEIDHIHPLAKGGPTALSNLCRLCRFHHGLKTSSGYRIEGGPGRWRWVAPGRHGSEPEPAPAGPNRQRAEERPEAAAPDRPDGEPGRRRPDAELVGATLF